MVRHKIENVKENLERHIAWKTLDQNHFKSLQESLPLHKATYKTLYVI